MNNNYQNQETECGGFVKNLGQKVLFLAIGGSIGAGIALVFAPKPGREIREDIVDLAGKGYDQALETGTEMKHRTTEILETTLDTSSEILDAVSAGASEIKNEVATDVEKIGSIVDRSHGRDFGYARPGLL